MSGAGWYLIGGMVFIVMACAATVLKRLPLSSSMLYLAIGFMLGPAVANVIELDLLRNTKVLEYLTEAAVLISLFCAGLKLRVPLRDRRWIPPLRLATISMVLSIALVAAVGCALGLPLGAAVLLGAILAPTDPVLASDVQLDDAGDRDRLRFSLTTEAGLNDGTAFPFVMLGLGLLGLHELGTYGWRWISVDLIWASVGGLAIGAILGTLVARFVLYLRQAHKESVGTDDFLALGLIAVAYAAALFAHAYGFLAVFAAGVALRRIEAAAATSADLPQKDPPVGEASVGIKPSDQHKEPHIATDPRTASAHMAEQVLGFNVQLERMTEVVIVIVLGLLLSAARITWISVLFAVAVLFVIRPVSTYLGLIRTPSTPAQKRLIGWFGIRGVGSMYYLAYAGTHGLESGLAEQLFSLVITTVAASVVLHGTSVTPLMRWYQKRRQERAVVHSA